MILVVVQLLRLLAQIPRRVWMSAVTPDVADVAVFQLHFDSAIHAA
jgi:hypothetical protein